MSVSAQGVYSQTLQSIISTKLEELALKRDAFESTKGDTLEAVRSNPDSREQLKLLLDGVQKCFKISKNFEGDLISSSTRNPQLFLLLNNLERFCEQPRFDPSISGKMLSNWKASLLQQLNAQSARYEYASLYGHLVTDWLSAEKGMKDAGTHGDFEMAETFEELDSSAKMESRLAWEETAFKAADVDTAKIKALLMNLFGQADESKKQVFKALETLRYSVGAFENDMARAGHFNEVTIATSIDGLLSGELLNDEKRTVLKDFRRNPIILAELADVLNLRMANIEAWNWGEVVPLEQQKRVAGQYSVYMHEDLLQAVFLQYIGVKWSVFLRNALFNFIELDRAWRPAGGEVSTEERKKREYYLGQVRTKSSLQAKRERIWRSRYFMTQLPSSEQQSYVSKDGDEEANFVQTMNAPAVAQAAGQSRRPQPAPRTMQTQAAFGQSSLFGAARAVPGGLFGAVKKKRAANPYAPPEEEDEEADGDEDNAPRNLMDLKQGLLHLLRTEILINTRLHGQLTAFRGQFKSWNSLLPHTTIMMVLTWFGVSRKWLKFIETFLQAPLGFIQDSTIEPPRTRKRGVPGSHPLSDVLGEAIFFCLDLAVNQECDGAYLYRIYDDFWFWHPDAAFTEKAWSTITQFGEVMGLTLDHEKSGSARVTKEPKNSDDNSKLPPNPIRWGFLYLDSQSGRFKIDDSMVERHVDELKHQLEDKVSKGVLAWVQAWNTYANTFFTANFGKAANCFGAPHTDMVLATLERVQRQLSNDSNVVDYLCTTLSQRYGVKDIPEGYIFFPTELGGLELRNPFVALLQVHMSATDRDPQAHLDRFFAAEITSYEKAKEAFDKGQVPRPPSIGGHQYMPQGSDKNIFFSFKEYTRHREAYCHGTASDELGDVYSHLLEMPTERAIDGSNDIAAALQMMDMSGVIARSSGINGDWHSMTPYWKWIAQMYGPDVVSKFGGMNIVDNGVLPIGMVSLFRTERVQWKG